jgi:transposase
MYAMMMAAQVGLAVLKSRDALVRSRVAKVAQVRGVTKSFGVRLPRASSASFPSRVRDQIPSGLQSALHPLLDSIESDTILIKGLDREIRRLSEDVFPETRYVRQVNGVGVMTSLAFVLVLEDPRRFVNSRAVGAYLGLRPRQHESGTLHRQLRITKAGDSFLRVLLVQCAQYILGPFGEDCDLRRWGLARAERGGRSAKRRAVVAVARKLATVLHRLWMEEAEYEPLRHATEAAA